METTVKDVNILNQIHINNLINGQQNHRWDTMGFVVVSKHTFIYPCTRIFQKDNDQMKTKEISKKRSEY